jgi:hypothetical protein
MGLCGGLVAGLGAGRNKSWAELKKLRRRESSTGGLRIDGPQAHVG